MVRVFKPIIVAVLFIIPAGGSKWGGHDVENFKEVGRGVN